MENDESILFVTDDLSKEEIIERLKKICQFRFNISTLVNDGVITILSSTQRYFSGDILETGKLSPSGGMTMSKSPSPMHNDTSMENEDNIESRHFILPMDRKKKISSFLRYETVF